MRSASSGKLPLAVLELCLPPVAPSLCVACHGCLRAATFRVGRHALVPCVARSSVGPRSGAPSSSRATWGGSRLAPYLATVASATHFPRMTSHHRLNHASPPRGQHHNCRTCLHDFPPLTPFANYTLLSRVPIRILAIIAWLVRALPATIKRWFKRSSTAASADADEPGHDRGWLLYRFIKGFLVLSLLALVVELTVYWKGWRFQRPDLHVSEVVEIDGWVHSAYISWMSFQPTPDFLKKMIPHFEGNPELGLVQARWGFVNKDDNLLTHLQNINLCFHFEVEQHVNVVFLNFFGFNGTARVRICLFTIDDLLRRMMSLNPKMSFSSRENLYLNTRRSELNVC
ncbi:hypothetical protein GUJ93_ZPchr0015g6920 [Zizania palustris]|uniref:Uncharacterized protein n=1 Tax=Zizania palustris TaxID=103762 RepID=A0A8J5TGI7_ZIZPA|nr:hypothetical protein GUJ93_ZPchr0015g6920 [Zizania palustris]